MKSWMFGIVLMIVMLAGCSAETVSSEKNQTIATVNVQFINKEKFTTKEIPLEVSVTQQNKPIEDATFVRFEIWPDGQRQNSRMIDAEHIGNGHYIAKTKVQENGVYYIYAHTEANGLHVMPKQKITVQFPTIKKE